ncbi:MAG TPA: TRAP transporter large permease [Candidatus Avamphibacillus sp.]|nr:TRAP transporter large permease [Candidatus Avamphibacillus sp.]
MALLTSFIVLIVFFALNVPIAFALFLSTLTYFFFIDGYTPKTLILEATSGIESFPLLAVVFFLSAGVLMNYTGITSRMLKFAQLAAHKLPGTLAQVNIILSTVMGGLSGSNIADAAMQSKVLVPEMEKNNYGKAFSTALTAATSLITPIIPPGIALILYGYIGNVSIGDLFIAGVVPGVLLCFTYMVYVHFYSKKHNLEIEKKEEITKKEIFVSFKDALLALLLPVIIIGGIRIGVFSATEAGAIAVFYALFLGLIVYREMTLSQLARSIVETLNTAASVLIIIASGSAFAWVLTLEEIPQKAAAFMSDNIGSPYLFLGVALIFLLIIGMFVEGNVSIVVLTPLFMPIIQQYDIDPVHFGIFFILCVSIGTLTPPLGTIMYVTSSITGAKIEDFVKESIPFLIILIVFTLIIALVPSFSLWLPNLLR